MAPSAPIIQPTASLTIPGKPYVLSFTPLTTSTSSHLILRHPSPNLTIVDAETLQAVGSLKDGHQKEVTCVVTSQAAPGTAQGGANGGSIWTSGKDAMVVRWDERSRNAGQKLRATNRGAPLPLLSLAVPPSGQDNLLVAGSELVGSEAWLVYWDTRNPTRPIYAHSSTHSDDITSLSFLPPTSSYLPPAPASATSAAPVPSPLLLSGSTDGLIALSNPKEEDEDDAFWGAEGGLEGSVAQGGAGAYSADPVDKKNKGKGKELRVWGRSDQDGFANWSLGRGEEGDIEFQSASIHQTSVFKPHSHPLNPSRPVRSIRDEAPLSGQAESQVPKDKSVEVDYVIDVCPSLGINGRTGQAVVGAGSNTGDIVLLHHEHKAGAYKPSAFLVTPASGTGHKDVVRCMYHDVRSNVLYTGSEDGILSGWNLPDPSDFLNGDVTHDDDGGDGREDVGSDDESSQSEDEDEMDVDDEDDEEEKVVWGRGTDGKRLASEVWGGGSGGKKKRA